MFDYTYFRDDGTMCYVAEMSLAELHEAIADTARGEIECQHGTKAEDVLERLRIELLVRELKL